MKKVKDKIRISCSALASINIDGKYLLIQNKRAKEGGRIIYTPVGGALEYNNKSEDFLNNIEFIPERITKDLRFTIPIKNIDLYGKWFNKRINREVSSYREMFEELVLEENVLEKLERRDVYEKFQKVVKIKTKHRYMKCPSLYYFEIFKVKFYNDIEIMLKNSDKTVKLFTKQEILNKISVDNDIISNHSRYIII